MITVWALELRSQDYDQNYLEFQDPAEVTITGQMTVTRMTFSPVFAKHLK